jgi:hypothetical protein
MTYDEQMNWIAVRERSAPYWAAKEYDIRRQAAQIMEQLYSGEPKGYIEVAVYAPGRGPYASNYTTVRINKHDVARVGGLEGTLMVEEIIRRAVGLSFEHEAQQRLAAAQAALR